MEAPRSVLLKQISRIPALGRIILLTIACMLPQDQYYYCAVPHRRPALFTLSCCRCYFAQWAPRSFLRELQSLLEYHSIALRRSVQSSNAT